MGNYSYKIAEPLWNEFANSVNCNDNDPQHEIVDDRAYYIFKTPQNLLETLDKIIEKDDMFHYGVSVTVKRTGFAQENDKYYSIRNTDRRTEHIPDLLNRDFDISKVESYYYEAMQCTYWIYQNTDEFKNAMKFLKYDAPKFDDCVIVENKEYLTEKKINELLKTSGISDPDILKELRAKMQSVNDSTMCVCIVKNPYFAGWLDCFNHVQWIIERKKSEIIHTLEMPISELKELFDQWANQQDLFVRFIRHGVKK